MTRPPADAAAISSWLVEQIADLVGADPAAIDPDGPVDGLGLESVEVAILAGDLSDHLGWEVDVDLLLRFDTLGEIAVAVAAAAP